MTSTARRWSCRRSPTPGSASSTSCSSTRKQRSWRSSERPATRGGRSIVEVQTTRARYVAIITDGNGRWAQRRGLPVVAGHEAGADTVKARLRDCAELGVKELTVYSFSTENWSRSADEVAALMAMFAQRIDRETPELKEEGVRMRFVGDRDDPRIGDELRDRMRWAEAETAGNDRITLFVAFNYGGRAEILD